MVYAAGRARRSFFVAHMTNAYIMENLKQKTTQTAVAKQQPPLHRYQVTYSLIFGKHFSFIKHAAECLKPLEKIPGCGNFEIRQEKFTVIFTFTSRNYENVLAKLTTALAFCPSIQEVDILSVEESRNKEYVKL